MTKSTKKPSKPLTKRKKEKYPNLKKKLNLKGRRDYIDTFYTEGVKSITGKGEGIRALNEEEMEWLNKFYGEFVNAGFKGDGTDLHDTKELKKDCYDKNNARNRCLYNQTKKIGKLGRVNYKELDEDLERRLQGLDTEHLLIAQIEKKDED